MSDARAPYAIIREIEEDVSEGQSDAAANAKETLDGFLALCTKFDENARTAMFWNKPNDHDIKVKNRFEQKLKREGEGWSSARIILEANDFYLAENRKDRDCSKRSLQSLLPEIYKLVCQHLDLPVFRASVSPHSAIANAELADRAFKMGFERLRRARAASEIELRPMGPRGGGAP